MSAVQAIVGRHNALREGLVGLHWANQFAWSRERIGSQIVWHLHAKSVSQLISFDVAINIGTPRFVVAKQLRFIRQQRALMVRALKARGDW